MKSKDQILLEEAYKRTKLILESHTPYTGSIEDLIYVDDLESDVGKLSQEIENGRHVVLKYAAFKEDLQEMGMDTSDDAEIYLFDKKTNFTRPVFVLM